MGLKSKKKFQNSTGLLSVNLQCFILPICQSMGFDWPGQLWLGCSFQISGRSVGSSWMVSAGHAWCMDLLLDVLSETSHCDSFHFHSWLHYLASIIPVLLLIFLPLLVLMCPHLLPRIVLVPFAHYAPAAFVGPLFVQFLVVFILSASSCIKEPSSYRRQCRSDFTAGKYPRTEEKC